MSIHTVVYALFLLLLIHSAYLYPTDCIRPENYSDFNVVVLNKQLYITGGNRNYLEVLSKNISGIDTRDSCWTLNSRSLPTDVYQPYINGISFPLLNQSFAIQAGDSVSTVMSDIISYDTVANTWNKLSIKTPLPPPRARMSVSVNTTTHIAWFYGGRTDQTDTETNYFNDFYSYDIHTSTWKWPSIEYYGGIRPARYGHASLLISNYLFIMGGKSVIKSPTDSNWIVSPGDFRSILIFDTELLQSITMATIGDIPPSRYSFTAVNAPDGKSIVLFGGQNATSDEVFDGSNDVYVLDTCTLNWTTPIVQGTPPIPRAGHESVVYQHDYMIVLLGIEGYDPLRGAIYSNHTDILHMPTWTWVDHIPATPDHPATPPNCTFLFPVQPNTGDAGNAPFDSSILENKSLKAKQMAFGIIFGVVGVVLLITLAILILRRIRANVDASQNPRWMPGLLKRKKSRETMSTDD